MACINPDGTLTPTAKAVIAALHNPVTALHNPVTALEPSGAMSNHPLSAADIGRTTGLPIYRVRATLRELYEAGLVMEKEGVYQLTETGKQRL